MTFNFNVTAMKNELASGVSMDELAKAMTDALNEAQKQYEAEETKRKEVEAQKEKEAAMAKARADVCASTRKYLELAIPALTETCDESDWADLEQTVFDALTEMETAFKVLMPMITMAKGEAKSVTKTPCVPAKDDALTTFLKSNGLF
jgi:hypothetical protein